MALDTLADLRTELARRGFDYLPSDRLNNFIDSAYRVDVCGAEDWPFLETTVTSTAPIGITDLRTVGYVLDTTNQVKLRPIDLGNLTELTTDLTTTGTAEYYYTTYTVGVTSTVNVYPVDTTSTFSVFYYQSPPRLTGDTDVPVTPSRFASLIVDAAVVRAYEDDDESNQADAARARFEARLEQMKQTMMVRQHDYPDQWMNPPSLDAWGGF